MSTAAVAQPDFTFTAVPLRCLLLRASPALCLEPCADVHRDAELLTGGGSAYHPIDESPFTEIALGIPLPFLGVVTEGEPVR
jgi:hypothetical protein